MTNEKYDNCPYCNGKMKYNPIFCDVRCTQCNLSVVFGDEEEEDRIRLFNEFARHIREERAE